MECPDCHSDDYIDGVCKNCGYHAPMQVKQSARHEIGDRVELNTDTDYANEGMRGTVSNSSNQNGWVNVDMDEHVHPHSPTNTLQFDPGWLRKIPKESSFDDSDYKVAAHFSVEEADDLPDQCPKCGHDAYMKVGADGHLVQRGQRGTWKCEACNSPALKSQSAHEPPDTGLCDQHGRGLAEGRLAKDLTFHLIDDPRGPHEAKAGDPILMSSWTTHPETGEPGHASAMIHDGKEWQGRFDLQPGDWDWADKHKLSAQDNPVYREDEGFESDKKPGVLDSLDKSKKHKYFFKDPLTPHPGGPMYGDYADDNEHEGVLFHDPEYGWSGQDKAGHSDPWDVIEQDFKNGQARLPFGKEAVQDDDPAYRKMEGFPDSAPMSASELRGLVPHNQSLNHGDRVRYKGDPSDPGSHIPEMVGQTGTVFEPHYMRGHASDPEETHVNWDNTDHYRRAMEKNWGTGTTHDWDFEDAHEGTHHLEKLSAQENDPIYRMQEGLSQGGTAAEEKCPTCGSKEATNFVCDGCGGRIAHDYPGPWELDPDDPRRKQSIRRMAADDLRPQYHYDQSGTQLKLGDRVNVNAQNPTKDAPSHTDIDNVDEETGDPSKYEIHDEPGTVVALHPFGTHSHELNPAGGSIAAIKYDNPNMRGQEDYGVHTSHVEKTGEGSPPAIDKPQAAPRVHMIGDAGDIDTGKLNQMLPGIIERHDQAHKIEAPTDYDPTKRPGDKVINVGRGFNNSRKPGKAGRQDDHLGESGTVVDTGTVPWSGTRGSKPQTASESGGRYSQVLHDDGETLSGGATWEKPIPGHDYSRDPRLDPDIAHVWHEGDAAKVHPSEVGAHAAGEDWDGSHVRGKITKADPSSDSVTFKPRNVPKEYEIPTFKVHAGDPKTTENHRLRQTVHPEDWEEKGLL